MPLLIDGNNLMFALRELGLDVGREGLCRLLSELARRPHGRQDICVVFDGAPPHGPLARQIEAPLVQVRYAAPRTADDLILEAIAANTAPRRLTVVSADRQIRQAARRRRCRDVPSPQFAQQLRKALDHPPHTAPPEPPEKRAGSTPQQTDQWLREFGIDQP